MEKCANEKLWDVNRECVCDREQADKMLVEVQMLIWSTLDLFLSSTSDRVFE